LRRLQRQFVARKGFHLAPEERQRRSAVQASETAVGLVAIAPLSSRNSGAMFVTLTLACIDLAAGNVAYVLRPSAGDLMLIERRLYGGRNPRGTLIGTTTIEKRPTDFGAEDTAPLRALTASVCGYETVPPAHDDALLLSFYAGGVQ
jgi:hypothetical protein